MPDQIFNASFLHFPMDLIIVRGGEYFSHFNLVIGQVKQKVLPVKMLFVLPIVLVWTKTTIQATAIVQLKRHLARLLF
jgi:hypothetical protein